MLDPLLADSPKCCSHDELRKLWQWRLAQINSIRNYDETQEFNLMNRQIFETMQKNPRSMHDFKNLILLWGIFPGVHFEIFFHPSFHYSNKTGVLFSSISLSLKSVQKISPKGESFIEVSILRKCFMKKCCFGRKNSELNSKK